MFSSVVDVSVQIKRSARSSLHKLLYPDSTEHFKFRNNYLAAFRVINDNEDGDDKR